MPERSVIPALDVGICFFLQQRLLACGSYVPAPLRLAACATPVLHSHSSLFFARRADNTEAKDVVGAIGVVPVLEAHLAAVGVVVPAAAAVVA